MKFRLINLRHALCADGQARTKFGLIGEICPRRNDEHDRPVLEIRVKLELFFSEDAVEKPPQEDLAYWCWLQLLIQLHNSFRGSSVGIVVERADHVRSCCGEVLNEELLRVDKVSLRRIE